MRFIIFSLILAIFITAIYFYTKKEEEEIMEIKTNLNDYRIIPKDKGGVDTPDLNIYDLGD